MTALSILCDFDAYAHVAVVMMRYVGVELSNFEVEVSNKYSSSHCHPLFTSPCTVSTSYLVNHTLRCETSPLIPLMQTNTGRKRETLRQRWGLDNSREQAGSFL